MRRLTPANLSSAGAARDGAGFPDGFCSAFCLGGRLADRLGQSGRNGSERFPSDRKRSPDMSMATTCHENVSKQSQFIDILRRQQCRGVQISACPAASKAS
ncbi:hypothetical protein ACLMJV_00110 [Sinorhizobium meliloti]|uniref:hypothetical protein n=1 Tax=Rhizobium meliloti TaxID=382 RepID=UPI00398CBB6D